MLTPLWCYDNEAWPLGSPEDHVLHRVNGSRGVGGAGRVLRGVHQLLQLRLIVGAVQVKLHRHVGAEGDEGDADAVLADVQIVDDLAHEAEHGGPVLHAFPGDAARRVNDNRHVLLGLRTRCKVNHNMSHIGRVV